MMSLPPDLDHEKLAEFGLALLWLTAFREHQVVRAWKGMDWDLLDLLHQKGGSPIRAAAPNPSS
jgi:hypothetical protein